MKTAEALTQLVEQGSKTQAMLELMAKGLITLAENAKTQPQQETDYAKVFREPIVQQRVPSRRAADPGMPVAGIPGIGTLLYFKRYDANTVDWQGPLTLTDGTHVVIQARLINGEWTECKIVDPSVTPWQTLATFTLKPFGDSRLAQDVDTPLTGPMKVYRARARATVAYPNGRNCVRFQIVDRAGRGADEQVP